MEIAVEVWSGLGPAEAEQEHWASLAGGVGGNPLFTDGQPYDLPRWPFAGTGAATMSGLSSLRLPAVLGDLPRCLADRQSVQAGGNGGRAAFLVYVPSQAEELKPFLVHGAAALFRSPRT
jgi:hypothetical protein